MKTSNCAHKHEDGCGTYCKAVDMAEMIRSTRLDKSYPHVFFRTDCYGILQECRFKLLFKSEDEK
jgi:hypothetical protein